MSGRGPTPHKAIAKTAWPLRFYAPGKYTCVCFNCNVHFEGDKRASQCLECAVTLTKTSLEAAAAERDRMREALEKIDALDEAMGHDLSEQHAFEAVNIARTALLALRAPAEAEPGMSGRGRDEAREALIERAERLACAAENFAKRFSTNDLSEDDDRQRHAVLDQVRMFRTALRAPAEAEPVGDIGELITRLRRYTERATQDFDGRDEWFIEAASALEGLAAENARLRAALAQSELPCVYCSLPREEWAKCSSGFPDAVLSKPGFEIAFAFALGRHWPGMSADKCRGWLWDYLGVEYGDSDYVWSARAAEELAQEYISDFGEKP